jgi:hypothetical protein
MMEKSSRILGTYRDDDTENQVAAISSRPDLCFTRIILAVVSRRDSRSPGRNQLQGLHNIPV